MKTIRPDAMTITPNSSGINTSLSDEGLGQQPWWVEQWMELINSYRFKKPVSYTHLTLPTTYSV